jgi:hypothetical protein
MDTGMKCSPRNPGSLRHLGHSASSSAQGFSSKAETICTFIQMLSQQFEFHRYGFFIRHAL